MSVSKQPTSSEEKIKEFPTKEKTPPSFIEEKSAAIAKQRDYHQAQKQAHHDQAAACDGYLQALAEVAAELARQKMVLPSLAAEPPSP
jgi:hypothetical protein